MAVRDPDKVTSKMYRILKLAGIAFAAIWEAFGWLHTMQAVRKVVEPKAPLFRGPVAPQ
jgi:hypothetical protein